MLYQILFEDNSTFIGGTIENSLWQNINKPIKEITYNLYGKIITLKNFISYNHLVIKGSILGKGNSLIGTCLIAKDKNIIHVFYFQLKNKNFEHLIYTNTKKFQPPQMTGWKIGIASENPSFTIL